MSRGPDQASGQPGELATEARRLEAKASALVSSPRPQAESMASLRSLAEHLAADCERQGIFEAELAAACAACLRDIEAGHIPEGPVFLYLAAGTRTLADALDTRAGGSSPDERSLAAARLEIESFAPAGGQRQALAAPDVSLASLRKRRSPSAG